MLFSPTMRRNNASQLLLLITPLAILLLSLALLTTADLAYRNIPLCALPSGNNPNTPELNTALPTDDTIPYTDAADLARLINSCFEGTTTEICHGDPGVSDDDGSNYDYSTTTRVYQITPTGTDTTPGETGGVLTPLTLLTTDPTALSTAYRKCNIKYHISIDTTSPVQTGLCATTDDTTIFAEHAYLQLIMYDSTTFDVITQISQDYPTISPTPLTTAPYAPTTFTCQDVIDGASTCHDIFGQPTTCVALADEATMCDQTVRDANNGHIPADICYTKRQHTITTIPYDDTRSLLDPELFPSTTEAGVVVNYPYEMLGLIAETTHTVRYWNETQQQDVATSCQCDYVLYCEELGDETQILMLNAITQCTATTLATHCYDPYDETKSVSSLQCGSFDATDGVYRYNTNNDLITGCFDYYLKQKNSPTNNNFAQITFNFCQTTYTLCYNPSDEVFFPTMFTNITITNPTTNEEEFYQTISDLTTINSLIQSCTKTWCDATGVMNIANCFELDTSSGDGTLLTTRLRAPRDDNDAHKNNIAQCNIAGTTPHIITNDTSCALTLCDKDGVFGGVGINPFTTNNLTYCYDFDDNNNNNTNTTDPSLTNNTITSLADYVCTALLENQMTVGHTNAEGVWEDKIIQFSNECQKLPHKYIGACFIRNPLTFQYEATANITKCGLDLVGKEMKVVYVNEEGVDVIEEEEIIFIQDLDLFTPTITSPTTNATLVLKPQQGFELMLFDGDCYTSERYCLKRCSFLSYELPKDENTNALSDGNLYPGDFLYNITLYNTQLDTDIDGNGVNNVLKQAKIDKMYDCDVTLDYHAINEYFRTQTSPPTHILPTELYHDMNKTLQMTQDEAAFEVLQLSCERIVLSRLQYLVQASNLTLVVNKTTTTLTIGDQIVLPAPDDDETGDGTTNNDNNSTNNTTIVKTLFTCQHFCDYEQYAQVLVLNMTTGEYYNETQVVEILRDVCPYQHDLIDVVYDVDENKPQLVDTTENLQKVLQVITTSCQNQCTMKPTLSPIAFERYYQQNGVYLPILSNHKCRNTFWPEHDLLLPNNVNATFAQDGCEDAYFIDVCQCGGIDTSAIGEENEQQQQQENYEIFCQSKINNTEPLVTENCNANTFRPIETYCLTPTLTVTNPNQTIDENNNTQFAMNIPQNVRDVYCQWTYTNTLAGLNDGISCANDLILSLTEQTPWVPEREKCEIDYKCFDQTTQQFTPCGCPSGGKTCETLFNPQPEMRCVIGYNQGEIQYETTELGQCCNYHDAYINIYNSFSGPSEDNPFELYDNTQPGTSCICPCFKHEFRCTCHTELGAFPCDCAQPLQHLHSTVELTDLCPPDNAGIFETNITTTTNQCTVYTKTFECWDMMNDKLESDLEKCLALTGGVLPMTTYQCLTHGTQCHQEIKQCFNDNDVDKKFGYDCNACVDSTNQATSRILECIEERVVFNFTTQLYDIEEIQIPCDITAQEEMKYCLSTEPTIVVMKKENVNNIDLQALPSYNSSMISWGDTITFKWVYIGPKPLNNASQSDYFNYIQQFNFTAKIITTDNNNTNQVHTIPLASLQSTSVVFAPNNLVQFTIPTTLPLSYNIDQGNNNNNNQQQHVVINIHMQYKHKTDFTKNQDFIRLPQLTLGYICDHTTTQCQNYYLTEFFKTFQTACQRPQDSFNVLNTAQFNTTTSSPQCKCRFDFQYGELCEYSALCQDKCSGPNHADVPGETLNFTWVRLITAGLLTEDSFCKIHAEDAPDWATYQEPKRYECDCRNRFYGDTCKGCTKDRIEGYCTTNRYNPGASARTCQCQCFYGYYGEKCENKAQYVILSSSSTSPIPSTLQHVLKLNTNWDYLLKDILVTNKGNLTAPTAYPRVFDSPHDVHNFLTFVKSFTYYINKITQNEQDNVAINNDITKLYTNIVLVEIKENPSNQLLNFVFRVDNTLDSTTNVNKWNAFRAIFQAKDGVFADILKIQQQQAFALTSNGGDGQQEEQEQEQQSFSLLSYLTSIFYTQQQQPQRETFEILPQQKDENNNSNSNIISMNNNNNNNQLLSTSPLTADDIEGYEMLSNIRAVGYTYDPICMATKPTATCPSGDNPYPTTTNADPTAPAALEAEWTGQAITTFVDCNTPMVAANNKQLCAAVWTPPKTNESNETPEGKKSKGLGVGVIVGIVIGCLVFVIIIVLIILYLIFKPFAIDCACCCGGDKDKTKKTKKKAQDQDDVGVCAAIFGCCKCCSACRTEQENDDYYARKTRIDQGTQGQAFPFQQSRPAGAPVGVVDNNNHTRQKMQQHQQQQHGDVIQTRPDGTSVMDDFDEEYEREMKRKRKLERKAKRRAERERQMIEMGQTGEAAAANAATTSGDGEKKKKKRTHEDLPHPWKQCTDVMGQTYYMNVATSETTFVRPK